MSLARFAFQACSFNHSDIFPFENNDLRWPQPLSPGNCVRPPAQRRAILTQATTRIESAHHIDSAVNMDSETPVTGIQFELQWMRENDN